MNCPNCGGKNPQSARFCQVCGRSIASGNQQLQTEKIETVVLPEQSYIVGDMKDSNVQLATLLIIVGVAVSALSLAVLSQNNQGDQERTVFISDLVNGLWMAVMGVVVAAFHLRRRGLSSRTEGGTEEIASGRSFFREMESPNLLGTIRVVRTPVVEPEARVSGIVKGFVYLLSVFVPAIGSLAGVALYVNANPGYKRVGKNCIRISVVTLIVITALVAFVYVAIHL